MHDRRNGAVLIGLALVLVVLAVLDWDDPGPAHALVELGLALLGIGAGVLLVARGRR
jgi:hypothetical protein